MAVIASHPSAEWLYYVSLLTHSVNELSELRPTFRWPSYGAPAFSDVTTADWKLIMAYLLRYPSQLLR